MTLHTPRQRGGGGERAANGLLEEDNWPLIEKNSTKTQFVESELIFSAYKVSMMWATYIKNVYFKNVISKLTFFFVYFKYSCKLFKSYNIWSFSLCICMLNGGDNMSFFQQGLTGSNGLPCLQRHFAVFPWVVQTFVFGDNSKKNQKLNFISSITDATRFTPNHCTFVSHSPPPICYSSSVIC